MLRKIIFVMISVTSTLLVADDRFSGMFRLFYRNQRLGDGRLQRQRAVSHGDAVSCRRLDRRRANFYVPASTQESRKGRRHCGADRSLSDGIRRIAVDE